MDIRDVQVIETIIRQAWLDSANPDQTRFESWLSVDQDQALELIEMIPNRLRATPTPYITGDDLPRSTEVASGLYHLDYHVLRIRARGSRRVALYQQGLVTWPTVRRW